MKEKNCINCGELIDSTAIYCPYCCAEQPVSIHSNQLNSRKKRVEVVSVEDISVPVEVEETPMPKKKKGTSTTAPETTQKTAQTNKETVDWLAYHDKLTGLGNRAKYDIDKNELSRNDICIFYIDANHLKDTNDKLGHKYGDQILTTITDSMKKIFDNNFLYRIGGDEFVIFEKGIAREIAKDKIFQFKKLLSNYSKENKPIEVSASCGFACSDGVKTLNDLIEDAESMMYEEKRKTHTSRMFNADNEYDPNYDGYYNDVKAEYEEVRKDFDRENIATLVKVISLTVLTIFLFFYLL